jgi:hypothetical protein
MHGTLVLFAAAKVAQPKVGKRGSPSLGTAVRFIAFCIRAWRYEHPMGSPTMQIPFQTLGACTSSLKGVCCVLQPAGRLGSSDCGDGPSVDILVIRKATPVRREVP